MGSRMIILASQTYCASGLKVMAASPQWRETAAYHKATFTAEKNCLPNKKCNENFIHFHHTLFHQCFIITKQKSTKLQQKKHVISPHGKRSVSALFSFFDAQLFDLRWKRWWSRSRSRWSCLGGLKPGDLSERSKDPRKLSCLKKNKPTIIHCHIISLKITNDVS